MKYIGKIRMKIMKEMKEMKKYCLYSLCLLLLVFHSSCLFQEEDVFDEPAAQRLNHALTETETFLGQSSNGWVMEYFPTNEQAGSTFLMKFSPDGKVLVATKNAYTKNYTEESGCWEMIGDNGPVLTFNTFINIFHLFSDPRNPGNTGYNGVGLGGDYEFMVLEAKEEQIKMKGKKRGTDIVLKRMSENQNWEAYFEILDKMDTSLFNQLAPVDWTLTAGDKVYTLKNGASHIFTAQLQNQEIDDIDDEKEIDVAIPIIITDYGFRFAQPFSIDDITFQSFVFSDDKQSLHALENSEIRIAGVTDLADYFIKNRGSVWKFEKESMPGTMKQLFERITNSCVDLYAANDVTLAIAYTPGRSIHSLRILVTRNNGTQTLQGNLDLIPAYINTETVSFTNNGRGDNNGNTFYSRIDGLKEMLELLSTSFQLHTRNQINPVDMKFTGTGITFQAYQ